MLLVQTAVVVRRAWSASLAQDLKLCSIMKSVLPPSKLVAKFSSASTVDCAVSTFVLPSMLMRTQSKKRKPDVDMRVYLKAVDVASGPRLFCLNPRILPRGLTAVVLPLW